jgi:hypothetical protein
MASILSAGTTTSTALNLTADVSGSLILASNNNVTAVTIDANQNATFANNATFTGNVNAPNTFGFKNRIINGAMTIAQRATSVTGADAYCCVDRFDYSRSTIVWNAAQSTDVPSTTSFRYSTSVTVTTDSSAAGAYAYIYQAVEGYNWADLGYGTASAQTSTLSFWVKSSLTGTFGIALRNTGTARFYTTTYTINSANTWEQKTITITGDTSGTWNTTNGAGIQLFWDLGVGSTYSSTSNNAWSTVASNYFGVTGATKLGATNGATFFITGVQLETGSTATSFDYRDYGRELIMCQRYFQLVYPTAGNATTSTVADMIVSCFTPMRANATLNQNGVLTVYDDQVGPFTQSSTSIVNLGNPNNIVNTIRLSNFSGMTANRFLIGSPANPSNYVTLSAEL